MLISLTSISCIGHFCFLGSKLPNHGDKRDPTTGKAGGGLIHDDPAPGQLRGHLNLIAAIHGACPAAPRGTAGSPGVTSLSLPTSI